MDLNAFVLLGKSGGMSGLGGGDGGRGEVMVCRVKLGGMRVQGAV